jgi:hypothetical protein
MVARESSQHQPPPIGQSDPRPVTSPRWQHLDAMLDEAGRQSFPASDPPALFVEDSPTPPPREPQTSLPPPPRASSMPEQQL